MNANTQGEIKTSDNGQFNTKGKLAFFVFIPLAICSIILRVVQLCVSIDLSSGMFYHDAGFMKYALYLLLIVSVAACAVLIFRDKKRGSATFSKNLSNLNTKYATTFSYLLLAVAATVILKIPEVFSEGRKSYPLLFVMLLGVLTLGVTGFYGLRTGKFNRILGFLLTGVTVYFAFRVVGIFLGYMAIASVSQYVLVILSRLVTLFFLFGFSRILIGAEKGTTRAVTLIYGFAAVLLIFSADLAPIVANFFVDPTYSLYFNPENLFTGFAVLWCVISLYVGRERQQVATDIAETEPTQATNDAFFDDV